MSTDPPRPDSEDTVDVDVFEDVAENSDGRAAKDWTAGVPKEEWADHEDRLRSVVDAQQEAEILGSEILIGW